MGDPARMDGPEPEHPAAAVLDPRKLIWGDVRAALVLQARACALHVAEMARRPDDGAALEAAWLNLAVLERLGEMARQWTVDEAVIEAERAAAYAEGYEACKAARCRLHAVD
jgi:hypothetical protein